ncbi:MAG TPA: iron-containing alcohol dehydrogenase, partial [Pirellulaceae bacterium]|nr:iron-containing alcohol dehydrogenase [Pirellulaceae bacterium]
MTPFDFQLRTRIVFGPDTIDKLGELASELGARRAVVVSDPGVIAVGHAQRGLDALKRAGIDAHLFEGVHENPSTDDVDRGVAFAKRHDPEVLVGLGGGSSMDCAKGINFLYSNGGKMQDYWGVGKALKPMLPMIAVPTTSGTGSETQSFALISDAKTHAKMALIVRREGGRLVRYAHLGTGNYHSATARLYEDFGMFTCNEAICADVHEVFRRMTGLGQAGPLRALLQAPFTLADGVVAAIGREAEHARAGRKAYLAAKMNSLVDTRVVDALYEASQAGVKIDLIVRGI